MDLLDKDFSPSLYCEIIALGIWKLLKNQKVLISLVQKSFHEKVVNGGLYKKCAALFDGFWEWLISLSISILGIEHLQQCLYNYKLKPKHFF